MRSMRHPNPLIDVRRPFQGEKVGLNPPGFVWKPVEGVERYRLEVCRQRDFAGAGLVAFEVPGPRTLFVPPEPLEAGRWFWRWGTAEKWSQTFRFDLLPDAAPVRLGSGEELAARLGAHPRAMVAPGGLADLRADWARDKVPLLEEIRRQADLLLPLPHELPEPPFLSDRSQDYSAVHVVWREAMNNTRAFCGQMVQLALAYLVSGDARYGQAVGQRLDSLSRWDPDGSTAIARNDEPHMAVMDAGPIAFDWAADLLDGPRRDRIVAHLGRRAENTHRFLRDRLYGISHFSSHSGRMVGFLGQCGLALGGHDARAGEWLRFVLELAVSTYPAFGQADGGWGEGFSYGSAYVRWLLRFCWSVRTALGIDLYHKPFFRNHARWWAMCLPEYAFQTPFGDGGDRSLPLGNAAAIALHLGTVAGDAAAVEYAHGLQQRLAGPSRDGHGISTDSRNVIFPGIAGAPEVALLDGGGSPAAPGRALPRAEVFPQVGYVAMRRNLHQAEEDICLVLKSSPFGAVSHSHGDQNCFVLSAYGEPLAIRTGYYTGYDDPHHCNWVRQTKAHNGLTVGGVGQWVRNPDAVGRIAAFLRRGDFAYACGDAGRAYGDRLSRFHRHVLFVGYRYFLIVDDAASPVATTYEFHLHGLEPVQVDQSERTALVVRKGAELKVHFLAPVELRLYATEGFDPGNDDPGFSELPIQYHARAATVPPGQTCRAGMVLLPNRRASPDRFDLRRFHQPGVFGASVSHADGQDEFVIASGQQPLQWGGQTYPGALAVWLRDGALRHILRRPGR